MTQHSLFDERPRRPPAAKEVRLVLPYPPSANTLKAIFTPKGKAKGRSRMIDSEVGRAYKAAVKHLLQAAGALFRWSGPILMEMDVFRPRRSGDLMNREKVLSDGLQTEVEKLRKGGEKEHPGLFEDDEQVVETRMRRFEDKEYPRVQVLVRVVPRPSGASPERWPQPPGWEQALAMLEQAMEKRRQRERKKRQGKVEAPEPATAPTYKTPLPSGSKPGTASYGSTHFPGGRLRGLARVQSQPRRGRKELAALATPASYRPLSSASEAVRVHQPATSAERGKHED